MAASLPTESKGSLDWNSVAAVAQLLPSANNNTGSLRVTLQLTVYVCGLSVYQDVHQPISLSFKVYILQICVLNSFVLLCINVPKLKQ